MDIPEPPPPSAPPRSRGPLRLVDDPPGPSAEAAPPGVDPADRECLPCYVARGLAAAGCDGTLRWSRRWRDACAPRSTALERRLEDRGGFCDCEVLFNVFPERLPESDDDEIAPCAGVSRRGSTSGCAAGRR